MPQRITCGGCGEVFYNGNNLKLPEEIVQKLEGVCPKCGKKLSFNAENVDVQAPKGRVLRR